MKRRMKDIFLKLMSQEINKTHNDLPFLPGVMKN